MNPCAPLQAHPGPLRKRTSAALALVLAVAANPTLAADPETPAGENSYSVELRVGTEYDSNVSVDELDASNEEGDYVVNLEAQVEFQHEFAGGSKVSAGYDFSQNLYRDFDNLDRQTHIFSGNVESELGDTDVGLSYHYVDSRLDGDDFLTFKRTSPYISAFLSRKLFARMAYVYTNKEIIQRSDRDADSDAGELDLYYFVRGLRSYFNVGYRHKNEEANAERFDYKSSSFKLRYVHRLQVAEHLAKLELAWRFEDRDYSAPTPDIGEDRNDDRHRLEANLEIPLWENAAVNMYYKYSNYDSNQPRADYNQHIAGGQFIYRW